MGNYRAQNQSIYGEVGGPAVPRGPQVDVPGAIDALTNGASSLIHGMYLRRQADQMRDRQAKLDAQTQGNNDRDYALRVEDQRLRAEAQRRQDLTSGITPGRTTIRTVPEAAAAPPAPASSIQDALTAGLSAGTPTAAPVAAPAESRGLASPVTETDDAPGSAITSALTTPITRGSLGSVPRVEMSQTEDSYDPTKAATYIRSTETANIRAGVQKEIADKRNATQLAARETMGKYAVQVAHIRAQATAAGKASKTANAMTGNQREQMFEKVVAPGLLAEHGGNLQEAIDNLTGTDEGKALMAQGFTTRHLAAAYDKKLEGGTKAALSLQSGALGMTPDESVGAVRTTRQLVGGGASAAPAKTATPAKTTAPSAPTAGGKRTITQDQADFLRTQKKMTDAQITARYIIK